MPLKNWDWTWNFDFLSTFSKSWIASSYCRLRYL